MQYLYIDKTTPRSRILQLQCAHRVSPTLTIDTKTVYTWGFWYYPANTKRPQQALGLVGQNVHKVHPSRNASIDLRLGSERVLVECTRWANAAEQTCPNVCLRDYGECTHDHVYKDSVDCTVNPYVCWLVLTCENAKVSGYQFQFQFQFNFNRSGQVWVSE